MIRSEKAVSEVIGMVMILSIMVIVVGSILLVGVPMIESGKERARMDVAANSFLSMQNDIEEVVRGPIWIVEPSTVPNPERLGPSRETEFELMGGTITVFPNSNGITYQVAGNITHGVHSISLMTATIPDDLGYAQQWSLQKIAWDQAFGNVSIKGSAKLAILDTGIDATHPDLAGRMIEGKSFVDGDPNTDPNGHGTALAGIAAALVNNSAGIAGVSYANTGIMSVQVLHSNGTGYDKDVVAGVLWAADNGADVILMGLSSPDYSVSLNDAIQYAWKKGAVVVAATGNDGSASISYPSGMENVIGVAATDENDNIVSNSNTGSASVAAPGVNIYTTLPGGSYGSVGGTSAASAHAAGLAVLLAADGRSNGDIYDQIRSATDHVVGKHFGRINITGTLGSKVTPLPRPSTTKTPLQSKDQTYIAAAELITLSQTSGPVGTIVNVIGDDFGTNRVITITFNGLTMTTSPSTCNSDGGGEFTCSFIVPTIGIGVYQVEASHPSPQPKSDKDFFTIVATPTDLKNFTISSGNITYGVGQESIIYENGAVIRKYEAGSPLMISDPFISIYDSGDGNNMIISFHAITINGTSSSTGGDGKAWVETRLMNYRPIVEPSNIPNINQTNITIYSKYSDAWKVFFNKKLSGAGLILSNEGNNTGYNISSNGNSLKVQIYGKSASSALKDIYLSVYETQIDVKVR